MFVLEVEVDAASIERLGVVRAHVDDRPGAKCRAGALRPQRKQGVAADVVHERGIGVESHEPGVARIGQDIGGEEGVLDPIPEGDVEQGEAHGQARQGLRLEVQPDRPAVGALLTQRGVVSRPDQRHRLPRRRARIRQDLRHHDVVALIELRERGCLQRARPGTAQDHARERLPAQAELRRRSVAECAVVLVARGRRQLELPQAGQRVVFPEHRDDDFRESAGGLPVQANAELGRGERGAVCRKSRAARAGPRRRPA